MGMWWRFRSTSGLLLLLAVIFHGWPAAFVQGEDSEEPRTAALPFSDSALAKSALLKAEQLPDDWREHPLTPALLFAVQRYEHIREHVDDFTCVLAKRERIDDRLGDYEYLACKVRREQRFDDEIVEPFAVYLQFLAPSKVRGRKVLYVDGQHDNKMVVQNGGKRFSRVTVKIRMDSEAALRESRYPITELGLVNVVQRMIEQAQDDMRADPLGTNTEVSFYRGAKIDERACTHIRVVHAKQAPGMDFHLANIYVDDELHVPLRVEGFAWPETPDEQPPLLEEYTYTRLKLNVGLNDADFSTQVFTPDSER